VLPLTMSSALLPYPLSKPSFFDPDLSVFFMIFLYLRYDKKSTTNKRND
ncbi:MAG: hypothetical protein ACI8O8_003085, partial [Oleiphilaceae bacterium]